MSVVFHVEYYCMESGSVPPPYIINKKNAVEKVKSEQGG
jgi:hypothetical protein